MDYVRLSNGEKVVGGLLTFGEQKLCDMRKPADLTSRHCSSSYVLACLNYTFELCYHSDHMVTIKKTCLFMILILFQSLPVGSTHNDDFNLKTILLIKEEFKYLL